MSKQAIFDDLRSRLRGPVLSPGDAGYDECRSIWNGMIDRRPAAIARCLGVGDVVEAVGFARERGLTLSIKGGGHNIAGLALADGALTLDMSLMRGVWVDPRARVARAQVGCLLGDVDRETQLHGLAAVLGFVSTTGIAGLTLGGGFGYLTRRYGWTADNVRSMEVVTASGQIVRASAGENPDLFWALRGGGGNFGVVTQFEYDLYPVGPQINGGMIVWRGEDAAEVLELYRAFTRNAGPETTCAAVLRIAPPAPWLPAEIHGKPIAAIVVCHTGRQEDADGQLEPLKAFGAPVADIVMPRPYVAQQSLLDATQPKGRRYYWKSEYLSELSTAANAASIAHAAALPSPHAAVILFAIDGALNQRPTGHNPVGNRDAKFVLNITASWESAADDRANIAWARTAWTDMRRFSTGGTYINFLTEDDGDDRTRAAYGSNYPRLAEAKAKWDPGNMFRVNKNIPARRVEMAQVVPSA